MSDDDTEPTTELEPETEVATKTEASNATDSTEPDTNAKEVLDNDESVEKSNETSDATEPLKVPPPTLADSNDSNAANATQHTEVSELTPDVTEANDGIEEDHVEVKKSSLVTIKNSEKGTSHVSFMDEVFGEHTEADYTPTTDEVQQMAHDIIYSLVQEAIHIHDEKSLANLYITVESEHDQLTAFIEATLGALADDISMGEREYVSHDEAYFWMTYFFLQFCGFQIFLSNIDDIIASGNNVKEMAQLVVELVDNVAENAEYLHSDSDVPEHIAKNIIWQLMNSNMLQRRYNNMGVSYWQAGDILEEIIDNVFSPPESKQKPSVAEKFIPFEKKESKIFEEPEICKEYGGVFNVAENFVTSLIDESKHIVYRNLQKSRRSIADPRTSIQETELTASAFNLNRQQKPSKPRIAPPTIVYPRIGGFTKKIGKQMVEELVNKWQDTLFSEDWSYRIKFHIGQSDACSDYYIYEAKFGLPTALYPVPQATCSLLFTVEVSRVKPPVCGVNVSYKIEGNGFVYIPEEYVFQESWLLDVINAKLRFFSGLKF